MDEKGEKKVLIEETPTLDTYETRRRARLIMGGANCRLGVSLWLDHLFASSCTTRSESR